MRKILDRHADIEINDEEIVHGSTRDGWEEAGSSRVGLHGHIGMPINQNHIGLRLAVTGDVGPRS
jgi:hypothetical protein